MSSLPTTEELRLLEEACGLALVAEGLVSPNPPVGALVVRDGEVIGRGFHPGPGRPHAEIKAMADAGSDLSGATVICTLEPCSHQGRTPPCSDALIAAGIGRVVIGTLDPLERGAERRGGAEVLAEAGIDVAVATGVDGEFCRELAASFFTHAITGRPLVTLKLATSLDGRIATADGESQWITGSGARSLVHRWRAESDAIAVGIGTALADDPSLTARDIEGEVRQPLAVVFDTDARLPLTGALVREAANRPVLVIAGAAADGDRVAALEAAGVEVARCEGEPAERIGCALDRLGERGVQSLFVEGGSGLAGAFVDAGLVDRVQWFLAPMIIGGTGAPGAVGDPGTRTLEGAPRLQGSAAQWVDGDLLVSGRLRPAVWAEE